jgi:hypothetical protein
LQIAGRVFDCRVVSLGMSSRVLIEHRAAYGADGRQGS